MTEPQKPSLAALIHLSKRCVWNLFRSLSLRRLEATLLIVEAELIIESELDPADSAPETNSKEKTTALLDAPSQPDHVESELVPADKAPGRNWREKTTALLEAAWQSVNDGDAEKGWRCLKAAERLRLYGVNDEELQIEAKTLLAEATDESKGVNKWRKQTILELLTDGDCKTNGDKKVKANVRASEVERAKRILDEHSDNVYHKLMILKSRIQGLTIVSLIAVVTWMIWPPLAPILKSFAAASNNDAVINGPWSTRWLWFAVILSGVFGAVFSGFSSSLVTDQKKNRIPAELSTSTLTFARLALSMVSAIGVSIFLLSGVIASPKTLEFLLVVAFVSGFSDRLLLKAIESVAK